MSYDNNDKVNIIRLREAARNSTNGHVTVRAYDLKTIIAKYDRRGSKLNQALDHAQALANELAALTSLPANVRAWPPLQRVLSFIHWARPADKVKRDD